MPPERPKSSASRAPQDRSLKGRSLRPEESASTPPEPQVEVPTKNDDSYYLPTATSSSPVPLKHPMSEPVNPTPSAKRQKRETGAIAHIRWVHSDMKESLADAFRRSEKEFVTACNFWLRYIMWKKKDLTRVDKDQFCQAAFGTPAYQLPYNDKGGVARGNEPIGVRIHRQWTEYAKHVFRYVLCKSLGYDWC